MKESGVPDEMTETSPCKVPTASRPVRSVADDEEVIEISSDDSDSDPELVIPARKPPGRPKKPKPGVNDKPSTPLPKGKGKMKGPVTPTSPSGKPMSKAAKARLLEHYALELFEDLNKRVFGNALQNCEVIWSKLLSSTAGKAYLKKWVLLFSHLALRRLTYALGSVTRMVN